MMEIADLLHRALNTPADNAELGRIRDEVHTLPS